MGMWILLYIVSTSISYSQIDLMYQTNHCGVYAGEAVLSYPPIQPDMTRNQALTLVVVDSACRVLEIQQFKDSLSQLSDDSVRIALNAMMNLRRYYPIWSIHLISLKLDSYPSGYLMTYGEVYHAILDEYLRRNDTLSSKIKGMFFKDAVFIGEIVELSHDYDSTFFPFEGSIRCYRVRVTEGIIGKHIFPAEGEESDEIILSVFYFNGLILPATTKGSDFDKTEYDKLEIGGSYLFLVDIYADVRQQDVGYYQVHTYPGSFFRITDGSITTVFNRFGNDGETLPVEDAIQQLLITNNQALGK